MSKLLEAVKMPTSELHTRLSIIFGESVGYEIIKIPDVYFNNTYEDEWLNDEFVKHIIRTIDKSELNGKNIISPILGSISVERMSGGSKTCILIYKTDRVVYATGCGDNCIPIIEEILNIKDITINLRHWMEFSNSVYPIKCVNSGKVCHNRTELFDEYLKFK